MGKIIEKNNGRGRGDSKATKRPTFQLRSDEWPEIGCRIRGRSARFCRTSGRVNLHRSGRQSDRFHKHFADPTFSYVLALRSATLTLGP